MNTASEELEEQVESEAELDACYAIDEQAYEDAGESYFFKVWQRLCWSGGCRLCRRFPDGKPIVPGTATPHSIYNASRNCAKLPQYVTPGMPLLEVVFRGLMANGNEPMTFEKILEYLRESWGDEFLQRVESDVAVQRVLDGPNEYHIGRVQT